MPRLIDISRGYISCVITAANIVQAVEAGTDLRTAYDQFMDEMAEYLNARRTPRTAAQEADMVEAGVMFDLTKKAYEFEWPYIPLSYRDEAFIARFGHAAKAIVDQQEAQAAADRRMLAELDMTVEEYMQAATNALRDMLGHGRD